MILIPCAPSIVALTVDKIFNCVAIVGILSQTCIKVCKIKKNNKLKFKT